MVKKFRKKPVVIEAVHFDETSLNANEIIRWSEGAVQKCINADFLEVKTLEGTMVAKRGDYIIKGVNGEFYPCKPDIFEKTYEEVV